MNDNQGFVIQHTSFGLFYGTVQGLPLWTKVHCVNLDSVFAFPTISSAYEAAMFHALGDEYDLDFRLIEIDRPNSRASIASCIKAGLEGWLELLQVEGNC